MNLFNGVFFLKKYVAIILSVIMLFSQLTVLSSAETGNTAESVLAARTTGGFWAEGDSAEPSISSSRSGMKRSDYYYNDFQTYRTFEIINSNYYDSDYKYSRELRLFFNNNTDVSEFLTSGNLRFWLGVPKDMTIRFALRSYNPETKKYGSIYTGKEFKVSDNVNGYQEVIIPLADFNENKSSNFSFQYVSFMAILGTDGCTAETFLNTGEVLKASPFEIWTGEPSVSKAGDYVPRYYSINGDITVDDIGLSMDKRTKINAFTIGASSGKFANFTSTLSGNTKVLEAYSINAVIADDEYALTAVGDSVNVNIPITSNFADEEFKVGIMGENGFSEKLYDLTDEYLVVHTDELGDFLIIKENIPLFTLSATKTEAVYDNTVVKEGFKVVRTSGTAYQVLVSHGSSAEPTPTAATVKEWLATENGQVEFWVKAPYNQSGDVSLKLDLCFEVPSRWPHRYSDFTVAGDGKWHLVRLNASSFKGDDFSEIESYNYFYIRLNDNTIGAEYWFAPDFKFYGDTVTAEIPENEGNIELIASAVVDTVEGGWGHNAVEVEKNVKVYDNKFHSDAVKYTVTDVATYKFDKTYPYKKTPTGDEFKDFAVNHGSMRTFVKNTSGHSMTFRVGVKIEYKGTGSGWADLMSKVEIAGDGKWHEARVNYDTLKIKTTDAIYKALTKTDGYEICSLYFYVDTLAGQFTSTEDALYFTPLTIYNRSIIGASTDEINDANVKQKMVSSVETPSGGWSNTALKKESVFIADNKFYRTAFRYGVESTDTFKFNGNDYPYINQDITAEELTEYFKYHGDMRTYVKNVSGQAMTFKMGLKIQYKKADGSAKQTESSYKEVTIPNDGKWHEIRLTYSELGFDNTNSEIYKSLTGSEELKLDDLYFKVKELDKEDFKTTSDYLYFTPLEIYNCSIKEAETTDFAREYKQVMLLKNYRSDKTNENVSKESVSAENGSVFFDKVVTFTANKGYSANYQSGQIGFLEGSKISSEDFADWYYNDNAEMRFWIKTEKDVKFKFGIYIGGEVTADNIEVKGSDEWQEITLKRTAFVRSGQVEGTLKAKKEIGVNLFFYTIDGTFAAEGDSISFGQSVEFYSDRAYSKGDVNCDEAVNILDLVRLKKKTAQQESNVVNCDIDNSGSVEASDLAYLRRYLLVGKW